MYKLRSFKRFLSRKRQYNLIKIISLGCGLGVSLILIAKIYFEYSYDNYLPDKERIFQIIERDLNNNDRERIPGGFVYLLGKDLPQIEVSTRYRYLNNDPVLFLDPYDNKEVYGLTIFADSSLFDILSHQVFSGNVKQILTMPMHALVSQSFAKKLDSDILGKTIQLNQYPGKEITVGGIFADIPENTSFQYDVVISLPSLSVFDSFDGSFLPDGHNQFFGLVKLRSGISSDIVHPLLKNIQRTYQDELFNRNTYHLMPLKKVHLSSSGQKQKVRILFILAISLLLITIINYILLIISTVLDRYKEITVYKCYGAQSTDIVRIILVETILLIVLSLLIGGILILFFQSTIVEILRTSLSALFSPMNILLLGSICIFIIFITSYIPAYILTKSPVSFVMQSYKQSRKGWKLIILFIQFTIATTFLILVVIIWSQYRLLINTNPGYKYDNLVYIDLTGVSSLEKQLALNELDKQSFVKSVSGTDRLPIFINSGSWLVPLDESFDLHFFNMGKANKNYFSTMQIPLLEGEDMSDNSMRGDIFVSKSLAKVISEASGWESVIGKNVKAGAFMEEGELTIKGIYEDIQTGSFKNANPFPTAIGYSVDISDLLLVEFIHINRENIIQLQSLLNTLISDKAIHIIPYETSVHELYDTERLSRNSIMICCFVILMIVLMGVAAYINSEVNRRKSEIAIRKINGAKIGQILLLFIKDLLIIAVPALLIGAVVAYKAGIMWLENFYLKIPFNVNWVILTSLLLLVIIVLIVIMNCLYISTLNPIISLKKDE